MVGIFMTHCFKPLGKPNVLKLCAEQLLIRTEETKEMSFSNLNIVIYQKCAFVHVAVLELALHTDHN